MNTPDARAGDRATLLVPLLMLTVAYAAAALLGHQLSFGPAFASPLWPAAGVAAATTCLVRGGTRLWPGIAAGYVLFHLITRGTGAGFATALATGALFAVGPALQAVLAARLVTPGLNALAAGRDRAVLRVLLLAGPVACLIAPTLGVALLVLLGRIQPDTLAANWLTWWIGDSIGVVLIGPLAALALPAARHTWKGRTWWIAGPLLGASFVLAAASTWFHHEEQSRARSVLAERADLAHDRMRERALASVDAALATGSLFSASSYVMRAEFRTFTMRLRRPAVISLQWLPRVPSVLSAAGEQLYDFPAQYANPVGSQWTSAQLDLSTDAPMGDAFRRARDSGRPAASAPQAAPPTGNTAVLLFVPVYEPGVLIDAAKVSERRAQLAGMVLAVLDPQALLASLSDSRGGVPLNYRLSDVTPGGPSRLAHTTAEAESTQTVTIWQRDEDFLGRVWRIEAHAAQGYWQPGASRASQLFLLGSLFATFLFSLFVLSAAGRSRAIALEVDARTLEVEEGRRKLAGAMNIAGVVGWELDLERGEFSFDDRYFEFLGTTAQREGGHRMPAQTWIREFVHPADAHVLHDEFARALQPGYVAQTNTLEFRLRRRDGAERHVIARFDVDHDEQGRAVRALGSAQDVTERVQAEIARRESEGYSRSIVDSSEDCIKVLDLEGRLLHMTDKGRTLMCVPDFERIRNADWTSFWQRDEDRIAVQAALDSARAGQPARFTGHTPTMDGTPKWWDVVVAPIPGPDGEPVRLLGVSRDITAEREAKLAVEAMNADLEAEVRRRSHALAESERQLQGIFDGAAVGIVHAFEGELLRANAKFWEITGYGPEDRPHLNQHLLVHPDDLPADNDMIARLYRGEIPSYVQEKRYRRKDGSPIWVRVTGSVVRDENRTVLYRVAVIEDIEEIRRARAMRIASEKRYRDLFERNPTPMWTYDKETLAFTTVNAAALSHYGYTREEFLAMTLEDIRPAEDSAWLRERVATLDDGLSSVRNLRHCKKDGTVIRVDVSSFGLDDAGRASRLVLAHDVTERRRAEARIAGQKQVLEAIAGGEPLDRSLALLVRLVEEDSPGALGAIQLLGPDGRTLEAGAAPRVPADVMRALNDAPIVAAAYGHDAVAVNGEAPKSAGTAGDPLGGVVRDVALTHGLCGGTSLPIVDPRGGVLGRFAVFFPERCAISAAQRDLIETLTDTAAIAIAKDNEHRALQESEAKFRAIYEYSPTGIALVDRGGRILAANPRQSELTGFDEQALVGASIADLTEAEDVARDLEQFERVWRGELSTYSIDKRARHADGSGYWVGVSGSVVRDERGEPKYGIRMIEDITSRKRAEENLYQQQELNRLLLENLAEGVVACDAGGKLILFNKTARDWHGTDPTATPPEQWADHYDLYEGDGSTPLALERIPLMRALRGEQVRDAEMSITRKSMAPRFVLASGAPLLDADGNKRGAVVVMHDVTESRRAGQVAREALTTLDAIEDAAFIFDPQTLRFSFVNEGAVRQVGYSREELLTMTPVDIKPGYTEHGFRRFIAPMIRGELDALSFTTTHRHKSGADVPVEINLQCVRRAGERTRCIAVARDVSERQHAIAELERAAADLKMANAQVERERATLERRVAERTAELTEINAALARAKDAAEAASRAKSAFLATISHEIRTPMNGVLGAMELLEHADLDEEQAGLLGTAQGSARSLLGLLNDLLDMAKIEAGRIEIVPAPVSLESVVAQVVSTHLPNALAKSITLSAEVSPGAPAWVHADALRLRQVLGNLVSNAVKFTAHGGVELNVASEPTAGNRHRVRFTVRDTGAGIPADVLRTLFRPFEQGSAERARQSGGTGLGLAICRGLAERMGGRVWLDSEAGEGTIATLELELEQAEGRDAGEVTVDHEDLRVLESFGREHATPEARHAQVLVVDDHPVNRQLLVLQLRQLGLVAEAAVDGVDALDRLRAGNHALVITDCEMPRMDGFDLGRAIRRAGGRLAALPVIACTAHALPEVTARCRASGIDEVLTKPVRLAELAQALRTHLAAAAPAAVPAERLVPAAQPAVLDRAQLAQIIDGDPKLERELIEEFCTDHDASLRALAQAVAEGSHERCRQLAHRGKGGALLLGANRLAVALEAIEKAAAECAARPRLEPLLRRVQLENRALQTELDAPRARRST